MLVFGDNALKRQLGHEKEWALMNEISGLIKETLERILCWGYKEKADIYEKVDPHQSWNMPNIWSWASYLPKV